MDVDKSLYRVLLKTGIADKLWLMLCWILLWTCSSLGWGSAEACCDIFCNAVPDHVDVLQSCQPVSDFNLILFLNLHIIHFLQIKSLYIRVLNYLLTYLQPFCNFWSHQIVVTVTVCSWTLSILTYCLLCMTLWSVWWGVCQQEKFKYTYKCAVWEHRSCLSRILIGRI